MFSAKYPFHQHKTFLGGMKMKMGWCNVVQISENHRLVLHLGFLLSFGKIFQMCILVFRLYFFYFIFYKGATQIHFIKVELFYSCS